MRLFGCHGNNNYFSFHGNHGHYLNFHCYQFKTWHLVIKSVIWKYLWPKEIFKILTWYEMHLKCKIGYVKATQFNSVGAWNPKDLKQDSQNRLRSQYIYICFHIALIPLNLFLHLINLNLGNVHISFSVANIHTSNIYWFVYGKGTY